MGVVKCPVAYLVLELFGCLWTFVVLSEFVNCFPKSVEYEVGIMMDTELNQ